MHISVLAFGQLQGSYRGSTGKGHCTVKIKSDHSYEQEVTDCMDSFRTKGACYVSADTLVLVPAKIFNECYKRKNVPVTDTTSIRKHLCMRLTKYVVRPDSLIQLKKYESGYHPIWALGKVNTKK